MPSYLLDIAPTFFEPPTFIYAPYIPYSLNSPARMMKCKICGEDYKWEVRKASDIDFNWKCPNECHKKKSGEQLELEL